MSQGPVRQQIVDYLAQHGPIEDPSGRATSKLREACGYEGSEQGFTQMIAAMDRSGVLTREVKGKRTHRIAVAVAPAQPRQKSSDLTDVSGDQGVDYDDLAAALLVRVVKTITAGGDQREEESSWASRRIERLERRIGELERDLSRVRAESKAIVEERDDLKGKLEHTEGNLAVLTDRLASQRPQKARIVNRLGTDEQALLDQLRGNGPRRRSDRAG